MVALPQFSQQPMVGFDPLSAEMLLTALQTAHRHLELTATALETVACRGLSSPTQFSSARLRLSQANRERKAVLQRVFNFCSAASVEPAVIRQLQLREVELSQLMSDVIGRWTPESVEREWESYCSESGALRERMMETVKAEKALLYPLLRRVTERGRVADD
jgi:hypothetical protein